MVTKFIILTTQRSGSTYLVNLLGSHPQIKSYSELLNEEKIVWGRTTTGFRELHSGPLQWLRNISPTLFLRWCIFRAYPAPIRAVGFKLMYSQLRSYPAVASYVTDNRCKIVHLKRNNLLDMYISLKVAQATNIWHITKNTHIPKISLYLTREECVGFFKKNENEQKKYNSVFPHSPALTVLYENLYKHKNRELVKIENFLGVDSRPLHSVFKKINNTPVNKIVLNYDELKREFSHTRWGVFFTA